MPKALQAIPVARAVPFDKRNNGFTERHTQGAVEQARMHKRAVDYSLVIQENFSMIMRNPELNSQGSIMIASGGELFVL